MMMIDDDDNDNTKRTLNWGPYIRHLIGDP